VAERREAGRDGAQLRVDHEARGHREAVEQHPEEEARAVDDQLGREEQRPQGVVHGRRHRVPQVGDVGPVVGDGAVRAHQRHVLVHDEDAGRVHEHRAVADRGERAQQDAQGGAAIARPGRVPGAARRERVPARVQQFAYPVRVRHQHVALVRVDEPERQHRGHEREPLQLVGRVVHADRLHGQHGERERQQRFQRGPSRAVPFAQQPIHADGFEEVHVHRRGLVAAVSPRRGHLFLCAFQNSCVNSE